MIWDTFETLINDSVQLAREMYKHVGCLEAALRRWVQKGSTVPRKKAVAAGSKNGRVLRAAVAPGVYVIISASSQLSKTFEILLAWCLVPREVYVGFRCGESHWR